MSYIDQENGSRRVAIGGVVLLHIVVGYALISGFAITVIKHISPPTWARDIPPDTVPPPQPKPPTAKPRVLADDTLVRDKPIVVVNTGSGFAPTNDPVYPVFPDTGPPPQSSQPVIVSKARAAIPSPGRAGWVTNDDYPTAALRDEVQGVVGIDVTIGADGRVTACSVTTSSGNEQLDQATCRLYARRAHFQPALDDGGKPIVGHYSDRIRWQIPQ
jgi:protein TonB